jgi:CRP-like cAMP-binding protein
MLRNGRAAPGSSRQEPPSPASRQVRATFEQLLELGTPRHATRGEHLLRRHDPVDEIFLVRTGVVRLEHHDPEDGRATVAIVRAGGIVGDIPLFAGDDMGFDAVVQEDAIVFCVPRTDFLALLHREPALSLQWLRNVSCRLVQIQRHLLLLTSKDLCSAVCAMLVDAREQEPDGRLVVKLSHADLAALVGAKRPSVSRQLTRLRDDGVIDTSYRQVEILDDARLRELAGRRPGHDPCGDGGLPFVG